MIAQQNVQHLRDALADRYRIEGELGRGGMATVYQAEDLRHKRRVAVKVLHAEHSAAVGEERFLREITTAANLTHPHIVPVFDSGEADGQLYFVMPLMEGETLRARLEREGPLPIEDAIRLVRQVADGLEYAHGAGILHRDLKPENIMLSRGHAVLTDFGIAGSTHGTSEQTRLTQAGTSLGTAAYMSPEQATGEGELGPPSDVYALGSVLYELLTGEAPFTGPTFQAILVKRFTQEAPSCSSRRPDTPAGCDAAIAKALAREPADRFASAGAFAEAIATPLTPATAVTPALAHPPATERSIVVLPFANLSPDPDNEYFSDGLTEEIISDLSAVRALNVISRTSAMQLKGTTRDIRTLGRELGVRYVLEGGVRKAGNRLRITAQLIDARTDNHLWTEKFSGTMEDIFEVQERVSREIVNALNVTLTPDEDRRLADRPVRDPQAYDLYLRARQTLRRHGPEIDRGLAMVEQAIAIEGETPPLRGLRALAWVYMARSGWKLEQQPLDLAERETQALLGMAPEAAYTQALAGFVAYERGDQLAAVRALRVANEREPGDPDVLFFLGIALGSAGQAEAQLAVGEEWLATDPLASMAWVLAGAARWFVGRIEEAPSFLERALELEPESVFIPWVLGYTYAMLGRIDEAEVRAEWLMTHAPRMPYAPHLKSLVLSLQGRQEEACAVLEDLDTAVLDGHQSWHLAESFAMAGAPEQALRLLEQAIERGNYLHDFFERHGPFFEPLRGDPEFTRVVARAAQRKAEFAA
jgi:eukaryotic-like serine/threonine-protein kinase